MVPSCSDPRTGAGPATSLRQVASGDRVDHLESRDPLSDEDEPDGAADKTGNDRVEDQDLIGLSNAMMSGPCVVQTCLTLPWSTISPMVALRLDTPADMVSWRLG
jgi:hypothetical protein